jgi:hypothetical protein
MVSTRHRPSTGGAADGDDLSLTNTDSPAVRRLKQKLAINATSTLGGTQKAIAERNTKKLGTYTSRGAVYELEDTTPAEWIESLGSERKRKRRRRTDSVLLNEEKEGGKRSKVEDGGKEEEEGNVGSRSSPLRQVKDAPRSVGKPARKKLKGRRKSEAAAMAARKGTPLPRENEAPRQQVHASRGDLEQSLRGDQAQSSGSGQQAHGDSPREVNPPPRSASSTPTSEDPDHSDSDNSDEEEFSSTNLHLHQPALSRIIARSRDEARSKSYAVEMLPSSEMEAFAAAAADRQKAAIERLARNLAEMSRLNGRMEDLRTKFEGRREIGEWERLVRVARAMKGRERDGARPALELAALDGNDDSTIAAANGEQARGDTSTPISSAATKDVTSQESVQSRSSPAAVTRSDTPLQVSLSSSQQKKQRQRSELSTPNGNPRSARVQPSRHQHHRKEPLHNFPAAPNGYGHRPPEASKSSFVALVTNPLPPIFTGSAGGPMLSPATSSRFHSTPPTNSPHHNNPGAAAHWIATSQYVRTGGNSGSNANDHEYGYGYVRGGSAAGGGRPTMNPALPEQIPRNSRAFSEDNWALSSRGPAGPYAGGLPPGGFPARPSVGPGGGPTGPVGPASPANDLHDDHRRMRNQKDLERRNMEMWRVVG